MKLDVVDAAGKKLDPIDVDDAVFGIEPNEAVVHQTLVAQLAARRSGIGRRCGPRIAGRRSAVGRGRRSGIGRRCGARIAGRRSAVGGGRRSGIGRRGLLFFLRCRYLLQRRAVQLDYHLVP